MNLLAFETATDVCSVALETDGKMFSEEIRANQVHSRVLLPTAETLVNKAGLSFSKLDGLVVGTGPGGFTSLRIGLASVQGLALAHGLPIYPVSSLLNVASAVVGVDWVWVVMDARMGEVYTQLFQITPDGVCQSHGEARVSSPRELELPMVSRKLAVVGDGLSVYEEVFNNLLASADVTIDVSIMPSAIRALALRSEKISAWALKADYIRDQVTS